MSERTLAVVGPLLLSGAFLLWVVPTAWLVMLAVVLLWTGVAVCAVWIVGIIAQTVEGALCRARGCQHAEDETP